MAGIDSFVKLMLHCDGTDASTTFTDSAFSPKTVTANGDAQIDTAQSKFGGASGLFDGTGDYLTTADSTDWDFSTSDFTVDLWTRMSATTSTVWFSAGLVGSGYYLELNAGTLALVNAGSSRVSVAWAPSTNTWYHLAVARSGTVTKLFIDGVQQDSQTDSSDYQGGTTGLNIARRADNSELLNGWIDEFRFSKGTARWTSGFTPNTVAYSPPAGNVGMIIG